MHSYCLRCGRDLTPGRGHCGKCGARMWTGPRLPGFAGLVGTLRLLRYRSHLRLSGERERIRLDLPGASVFTVDRQSSLGSSIICRLTESQLSVFGTLGSVDVALADVRWARSCREWSEDGGYRYWVAIDLRGGQHGDPRGDLCLWCANRSQSEELAERITGTG